MKPIRSVLAAVDLGSATRPVLNTASTLAEAADARLHIVHSIELDSTGFSAHAPTFRALTQQSQKKLQSALQRWVSRQQPASVELIVYSRHRSIARRARQVRADVIVVGAHGEEREILGTTTDRLLRTASCPVWIARKPQRLPIRKMVVATDLSVAGHAALDTAAAIIEQFGSQRRVNVALLHIYNPALQKRLVDELGVILQDQAAGWVARYALPKTVRVKAALIKSFKPATGVLSYVRRHGADLLVLGTHGRGAVDRLLLGSVAARVLRKPACNTLAVPPAHN